MSRNRVADLVGELVAGPAEQLGLEVVDVDYVKEGAHWFLRIFIDKPGGVTLDDCQAFSRLIDPMLDEADPVPHAYHLQVSSPGLDRPLKKEADFHRFAGRLVKISTFGQLAGSKKFTGRLLGMEGQEVLLETEGGVVRLPWQQIASTRLVPEF